MNIGFVSDYFPPFAPGGAEWSTFYLAQKLAGSERVVVITPNYGAAARENMDGVLVERFAFPFKLRSHQALLAYSWHANPLFYLYSAVPIARRVKKYRLDILHVHHKQSLVGAVLAGTFTGTPVVASVRDGMVLCRYGMCLNDFDTRPQGCDWLTYFRCLSDYLALYQPGIGRRKRLLRQATALYHRLDSHLKKSALRRASAIITNSLKMRQIYASRGIHPEKIVTIYNPAPVLSECSPAPVKSDDAIHILYAGKISWGKGIHLLVEALPLVCQALSPGNLRVTVAGRGPLEEKLKRRVEELGLARHVYFSGHLPHELLQQLYHQVDLVVVPSVVQESFGRVALEALLSSVPVVASNRGGLAEIVEDGVTGFIVEPEPGAIARAVVQALQSPQLRQQVRDALPGLQSRFGADVTRQYRQLYRDVLAGHGRPRQEPLP